MPNLLGKKFHLGSLKPAIPFSGCRPNLRKTAMKAYRKLTALAAILHEHPADSVILIPETAAAALRPQTVGNLAALFAPTARFIIQAADAPLRLGYRQWLTVGALQRIRQNLPAAPSQADWLNILATHLIAPSTEPISNADIPPLAWAELADDEARIQWWVQCVRAYLDGGDFTPASRAALDACEQRIGCPLPPMLRAYHQHIGVEYLAEIINPPERIEPLLDAFPGLEDILEDMSAEQAAATRALVEQLIAFGDYLGNGNLWCLHRQTGQVWYCDHDMGECLTPIFDNVRDYLDAVMILSLAEAHDSDDENHETAEKMLRQRLGDAVVGKWMY